MTRTLCSLVATLCLAACASSPSVPPAAVSDLAPTGKLRAVINYGNPILAKRLGVAAELVTVTSAGQAVEVLKSGRVDVGFFAIDPARGVDTAFVEDMKASGYVAQALQRHAIEGAVVAPAGGAP